MLPRWRMGNPRPEKPFSNFFAVERKQRIQVAFSGDCFIAEQGDEADQDAGGKAPDVKQGGENQQNDPQEFQGIAQLQAGLGIVGQDDEGHIQHGLGVEPPGADGKVADHQGCDNA